MCGLGGKLLIFLFLLKLSRQIMHIRAFLDKPDMYDVNNSSYYKKHRTDSKYINSYRVKINHITTMILSQPSHI